jgi:ABC-type nitrate/sulfonate/bicarbonate transport system substrate-binding protein
MFWTRHAYRKILPAFFCSFVVYALGLALWGPRLLFAQVAREPLVIGYVSMNSPFVPFWIAVEKGFFIQEGLDVKLVSIRAQSVMVASLINGEIQAVYTSGPAALSATAKGVDLQMVLSTRGKVVHDVVARRDIEKPSDIKGRVFGALSIGGGHWMQAMLGLEHLGLDPARDSIKIVALGKQPILVQALESGKIDVTILEKPLSTPLQQKGFRLVAELSKANIPYPGLGLIFRRAFIQQRPDTVNKSMRAFIRAMGYLFYPPNKADVINIIAKRFGFHDRSSAEDVYNDAFQTVDRVPYPRVAALKNAQRLLSRFNPDVSKLAVEEVVDMNFMENLDKSGFIDKVYKTGGKEP